jgi:hypothetical protein
MGTPAPCGVELERKGDVYEPKTKPVDYPPPPRVPVTKQNRSLFCIVLCCVLWAAIGIACEQPSISGGDGSTVSKEPAPAALYHTLIADSGELVIKITETNTQPPARDVISPGTGNYYWVFLSGVLIDSGTISTVTSITITFGSGFALTLKDDGTYTLSGTIPNSQGGNAISDTITFTGSTSTDDGSLGKVYIVGSYLTDSKSKLSRACYWKDGTRIDLPVTGTSSEATAIAISGTDVYIIGSYRVGSGYLSTACYWKNGIRTDLPITGTSSRAEDIVISGTDVYIAGTYGSGACYWKNGIRTDTPLPEKNKGSYAIAVSGTDVYITWDYSSGACYWKNGVRTDLPVTGTHNRVKTIAISGTDVYVTGSSDSGACYWKNGVRADLPGTGTSGIAEAIAISSTDVYISGSYGNDKNIPVTVCYWKNGNRTDLPGTKKKLSTTAIAVSGTDVYIAGEVSSSGACYWKNGNITELGDGSVSGIAVTQ